MVDALVRKVDNVLDTNVLPQLTIENPDPETYIVVRTSLAVIPNYESHTYRWNVASSTFYDCGPKPPSSKEKSEVILSPFATSDGHLFKGEGISWPIVAGESDITFIIDGEKKFDGMSVWSDISDYGVVVDLFVEDPLNKYGGFSSQKGKNWQIFPQLLNKIKMKYAATLYPEMQIRMKVNSPSDGTFYANFYLHKKDEE